MDMVIFNDRNSEYDELDEGRSFVPLFVDL